MFFYCDLWWIFPLISPRMCFIETISLCVIVYSNRIHFWWLGQYKSLIQCKTHALRLVMKGLRWESSRAADEQLSKEQNIKVIKNNNEKLLLNMQTVFMELWAPGSFEHQISIRFALKYCQKAFLLFIFIFFWKYLISLTESYIILYFPLDVCLLLMFCHCRLSS